MKIIKLERTRLGVLVTYKNSFIIEAFSIIEKREVVRCNMTGSWVWADTNYPMVKDSVISWFEKSKLESYTLNNL